VVVAEGNCSGCLTEPGWFLVIELRPIFTKRLGMVVPKYPLVEHSRFDCFYANSPLPACMFLSSGIVIGANAAFCSAMESELRSGVLGEHVGQVLARFKQVASEVLAGIASLSKTYFHLDQARSLVLENNAGTLVALSFQRGSGAHVDYLRAFLLTMLTPETPSKRRRHSSIKL
jgi:hypothetical protein